MAKYIEPPKGNKEDIQKAFEEYLSTLKSSTGAVNFKYDFSKPDLKGKVKLFFTLKAWTKIQSLVQMTTTEIGWHGIVEKRQEVYFITDIMMYPQTVTGATVDADETEYPKWIMKFDDETFNKIRMQGHSHVNFGVTPSATDLNFYDTLLQNLNKDEFYIFMIINKRNELNIWIYDYPNNMIYENKDIDTEIMLEGTDTTKTWYDKQIKEHIKTKKVTSMREQFEKRNTWYDEPDQYGMTFDYDRGVYIQRGGKRK